MGHGAERVDVSMGEASHLVMELISSLALPLSTPLPFARSPFVLEL